MTLMMRSRFNRRFVRRRGDFGGADQKAAYGILSAAFGGLSALPNRLKQH
jgi:hypothetical protein